MKVTELKLESSAIDFLKLEGYEELFEPQERSVKACLLYTSPSPRDKRQSRMPSYA